MQQLANSPRSRAAAGVFDVLDPIPFGFLVAAFVFDAIYFRSGQILWVKSAAWLIAIGLLIAIVPRLINLVEVWFPRNRPRAVDELAIFWLHLLAIGIATVNAFVHSRDAYGVMPDGLWLSAATVLLLVIAKALPSWRHRQLKVIS